MAFEIVFYNNTSQKNRLDKDLTQVVTMTGALRNACSIINPVIQIYEPNNLLFLNTNYMYIQVFGRYYFINNIISVKNDLFEVHAHVDVLSTYKQQIRANDAVIARNENKYNLLLQDDDFAVYNNRIAYTQNFPSGLTADSFVIALAGSSWTSN